MPIIYNPIKDSPKVMPDEPLFYEFRSWFKSRKPKRTAIRGTSIIITMLAIGLVSLSGYLYFVKAPQDAKVTRELSSLHQTLGIGDNTWSDADLRVTVDNMRARSMKEHYDRGEFPTIHVPPNPDMPRQPSSPQMDAEVKRATMNMGLR